MANFCFKNEPMPIWIDDINLSPKWLEEKTGIGHIKSCKADDISNENRKASKTKDSTTLRLAIVLEDATKSNSNLSLIMKQATDQALALSHHLGLAREAIFYKEFAHELPKESSPKIYYSFGDFSTGRKCIIMEDLHDAIDSGVLFGPGNPNNWKRDLVQLSAKAGDPPPSSKQVALVTFREIAKIHATYWNNADLLMSDKVWLRGQEWLQGKGRAKWEASQNLACNFWKKYVEMESRDGKPLIEWDRNVRASVEKAFQNISWEAQLQRLHNANGNWTLVHGDFWPGNVMWMTKERNSIRFLDWEMVGLGSGPQDLGQYVISNMDPSERKECENQLFDAYFEELQKQSIDCSRDYCWKEYTVGAVERWLWFLAYFVGNGMGEWGQFFHNQLSFFMKDHGITAVNVTQPRP